MKTPTELLKEEHTAVLGKLDSFQACINGLERREEISTKLKEIAAFFDKEEKALFPEFDSFMPHGVGPLAVMFDEHEVLRDTNTEMQQAIAKYLGGDDSAETKQAIRQNASHFIEFLRGHITKEDGILFRMLKCT